MSIYIVKMASETVEECFSFENMKPFPPVINGRVNVVEFLEASVDLVALVDRLGAVFAPVKYDMQGNIDKIKKFYKYNGDSCLLELMLDETSSGRTQVAEGVLWLNRALLFFELAFTEILVQLKAGNQDMKMKDIFTLAYEGSVKKYHNWFHQKIFVVICKMVPTFPNLIKCFQPDNDAKKFENNLHSHNITLHLVRCKIDDFFKDHNLFNGS